MTQSQYCTTTNCTTIIVQQIGCELWPLVFQILNIILLELHLLVILTETLVFTEDDLLI